MENTKKNPYAKPIIKIIYHFFRIILGIVLIYASIDKIISPDAFARVIYNYQILPDGMINMVAIVLPWIELVTGVFLIFQLWMPGTVTLTNLMLITFMCAIISALIRGLNIDCGCFSTSGSGGSINIFTFFRDISFVIMALSLWIFIFILRKTPVD